MSVLLPTPTPSPGAPRDDCATPYLVLDVTLARTLGLGAAGLPRGRRAGDQGAAPRSHHDGRRIPAPGGRPYPGGVTAATLDLALSRGRTSLRERLGRVRDKLWQIGQCAVAAGVAWFVAADLLGHPTPFFAPIAAVVSLGTSYGQRLRRVAEVTAGVALGVFAGDLLTHLLGSGGWQLALSSPSR